MAMQSIRSFIERYNTGGYLDKDTDIQIKAGWHDWFCKDTSLANKTIKLTRKLTQLISSKKIDIDKTYVIFTNNYPIKGSLYDTFKVVDIESGRVIYTIVPNDGHINNKGKANVWGKENDWKEALVEGSWEDVKKFFKV